MPIKTTPKPFKQFKIFLHKFKYKFPLKFYHILNN
jgi:hypothetical protein